MSDHAGPHSDARTLVDEFCHSHHVRVDLLTAPSVLVLEQLLLVDRTLHHELAAATPEQPAWGIFWRMLRGAHENALALVAMWGTEFPAQSEVVARALFEHSMTLTYLLGDPSLAGLEAYLRDFLDREEKTLRLIDADMRSQDSLLQAGLEQRRVALEYRRNTVDGLVEQLGRNPRERSPSWPSLFERCRELGLEAEYRLFYSALSAQTHGNAEDLLNEIMIGSGDASDMQRLREETRAFSWNMAVAALQVYLRTSALFSAGFPKLSESVAVARRALEIVSATAPELKLARR